VNGYIASALMGLLALIIGSIVIWLTPDDPPSSSKPRN
jgi:hypothetical protein